MDIRSSAFVPAAALDPTAAMSAATTTAVVAAAAAAATTATATSTTATTTVTPSVPTGTNKGCGVPECRKTNHNWCCGTEQCPMCHKFRKSFHCKTCVGNGDFGHSSASVDKGRFSKKQMKFQTVVYSSNLFKSDCTKMFSKRQCTALKKNEVLILHEKIKLLKLAISDKTMILTDKTNHINKIKLEIDNQKSRVDRYGNRVVRLEDFTRSQISVLNDKTNELLTIRPNFKKLIQTRIKQLISHIFTLEEIHPANNLSNEKLDVNTSLSNLSHALAEASKLTYVCGQWVDTCDAWSRQTELGYRIVAPTLPANGDYSSYNEWVSDKNKDFAFQQNVGEPNPACTISAALTYTSQLVKQLSFFLDIFLPRRPNFSEFCGNELNETKFSKYVTLLNANILYLCIKQNVDPKLLHADHTLKNLLQLLDTSVCDLGRFEPPDIDTKLCNALEDRISFQLFSCNVDSDSDDDNYFEWESVPNVQLDNTHTQIALQSTSSVVRAGLVASTAASIASMWRGWTK